MSDADDFANAGPPSEKDDRGVTGAPIEPAGFTVADVPTETGGEDKCDPLHGLVERTATDPGAPFAPEMRWSGSRL